MLADILAVAPVQSSVVQLGGNKSRWGGLGLKVAVDPTYDALYGDRGTPTNWQKVEEQRVRKLRAKADKLMKLGPEEALQYLLAIQAEAAEFGDQKGTGFLWVIYHRIAERCADPKQWIDVLVPHKASSDLSRCSLTGCAANGRIKLAHILATLLESPEFRRVAISRVIRLPDPPDDLLSSALEHLNHVPLMSRICG